MWASGEQACRSATQSQMEATNRASHSQEYCNLRNNIDIVPCFQELSPPTNRQQYICIGMNDTYWSVSDLLLMWNLQIVCPGLRVGWIAKKCLVPWYGSNLRTSAWNQANSRKNTSIDRLFGGWSLNFGFGVACRSISPTIRASDMNITFDRVHDTHSHTSLECLWWISYFPRSLMIHMYGRLSRMRRMSLLHYWISIHGKYLQTLHVDFSTYISAGIGFPWTLCLKMASLWSDYLFQYNGVLTHGNCRPSRYLCFQ